MIHVSSMQSLLSEGLNIALIEKVSDAAAEALFKELYPEILKRIDPKTIANLALAKAASHVLANVGLPPAGEKPK